MSSQAPAECRVSGALGCALRMSRVAGVAPLRFRRLRTGWRARVSPAANVYGGILTITMCVLALVAFVEDYYVGIDTPIKPDTRVKRNVYFVELTFIALVILTTSFSGSMRMNNMMVYLNQIHKINLELSRYGCSPSSDKTCWLLLILSMIGGISIVASDFGEFIYFRIFYHRRVFIASLYLFYFLMYVVLLIIQIQFALLVTAALSPLKQINGCLNKLLQAMNSQDVIKPSTKLRQDIPKAVHHLARLYGCACDVVRLVDKSHGPILLTLLLSYFLHLLISLYFIINLFLIQTGPFFYSLVIQSLWGIFQISSLLVVVEPCHQTQVEMAKTREIVSQMTPKVLLADDPLSIELELFHRLIVLNQVTYSPLKMLTVNRELVITMFSAITTYLVIVIQF